MDSPSPPLPPSDVDAGSSVTRPSLPSLQETEAEMTKRRNIYAELSSYLDDLRGSSSTAKGVVGSSSPSSRGASRPGTSSSSASVDFPTNFDEVVQLMTRSDLVISDDADDDAAVGGPSSAAHGTTGGPRSNLSGPRTVDSMDWSSYALSEGLSKLSFYNQYELELSRDRTERDRLSLALAHVAALDRKLSHAESSARVLVSSGVALLEDLAREVADYETQYEAMHGVRPPGLPPRFDKGRVGEDDEDDLQRLTRETLSQLDALHGGGASSQQGASGTTSPKGSARATSSKGNKRLFITDKYRKGTPRDDASDGTGLTARSESKEQLRAARKEATTVAVPNFAFGDEEDDDDDDDNREDRGKALARRNVELAGRAGQSSLTATEEARVLLLLGPDTEGDDENLDYPRGPAALDDDPTSASREVYGGDAAVARIRDIDAELRRIGLFERYGDLETNFGRPPSAGNEDGQPQQRGEGVLRARARARAEKSKEKAVDAALRALRDAPLPVVKDSAGDDDKDDKPERQDAKEDAADEQAAVREALSKPVTSSDIRRAVEEAAADMEDQGMTLSSGEDVRHLLARMGSDVMEKQKQVREEAEKKKRRDIEEILKRTEATRESAEATREEAEAAAGLRPQEPKKWASEIGELYQSGWDGGSYGGDAKDGEGDDDYYYDDDGVDEEVGGESKGDNSEQDSHDKENAGSKNTSPNSTAKDTASVALADKNDFFSLNMEMQAAQAKAQSSMRRADAAALEAKRRREDDALEAIGGV